MRNFHSATYGRLARLVGVASLITTSCILTPQIALAGNAQMSSAFRVPADSVLLAQNEEPIHIGGWQPHEGILLAQSDGDDAYDPFADYSEFEETMEEEEDINFFRNGRLLTMGFLLGYRGFTQNLGAIYAGSPTFGLFMSYFFDLRFALQLGYMTSDHTLAIPARNGADPVQGTVSITDLSFALKYYFNTQNVTRGLADLNPFVIAGFSQIYRTATVSGNDKFAKDSAFAFDAGAGLEIPMMSNKMYFGGQLMYQLINFSDEGKVIQDANDHSTGITGSGDAWNILGILGVNF
jgi:hypothetical protein